MHDDYIVVEKVNQTRNVQKKKKVSIHVNIISVLLSCFCKKTCLDLYNIQMFHFTENISFLN